MCKSLLHAVGPVSFVLMALIGVSIDRGGYLLAQIADEVTMPDFGTGTEFGCQNLAGNNVIRLSNGGTTAYFDKQVGRLLQITNQSGQPFTFGGRGECDNTGILQNMTAKNSNWRGCSTSVSPINLPYDYCSFTSYVQDPSSASAVYYQVYGGKAILDVVTTSHFAAGQWGISSYDPGGGPGAEGDNFTFWITYWIHSDGVIKVNVWTGINGEAPSCYSRWINFPFVLVSPFSSGSSEWEWDIGSDVTEAMYGSNIFYINNPNDSAYSGSTLSVTGTSGCPSERQGVLTGPYTNVTGSLPTYFGIHKSDDSRGTLAKVPTNTSALVLYQGKQPGVNGKLYELFVETRVPISTTWSSNYAAVYFIPWGGSGGISRSEAQSRLSNYTSTVADPGNLSCSCP